MRHYTVSRDKNGYFYAHRVGYSNIPVFGSWSKSRKAATEIAASEMALTYKEYVDYKKRHPEKF